MKINSNIIALSVVTILLFSSFQIDQAGKLVGTWKLTRLTAIYPKKMTGKAKKDAEADIKETGERLKKTIFVFTRDGHLSYVSHVGTYTVSKDGKSVDFMNDTKEKSTAVIVRLTAHELEFTREDDGLTQVFYLVK